MPTKSAGRVSIRVVPDSTRFKSDLEKSLDRIEKQLKAKIRVELDLNRTQLAKIKRQIESLKLTIRPKIELNVGLEEIFKVKEDIESMRPKVEVELNTKAAASRLASLSRTRVANVFVSIHQKALDNFVRKVGALSGLNVVIDTLRAGGDFVNNLDRHAVNIAKIGTLIAGIGGAAIAAAGGVFVLGQDLAAIGNLSILAPAFATGFAITLGVAIAALKDMKTKLADLAPAFGDLQNSISDGFWGIAEGPIRQLIKERLPALKEQTTNTGQALGVLFKTFADSMRKHVTPEYMDRVFDRMNRAIVRGHRAIDPFVHAFAVLGDTGSKYFGRFSDWIVKLAYQFDGFISKAAKDGRLDKWINQAIENTKDLGGVLANTGGIFNGIGDAAKKAGIGGLKEFKEWLGRIEDTVKSPRFQKSLTTLFEGGKLALDGFLQGIKNLGPGLESMMPTVKTIMGSAGRIMENLGTMVSKFLSNPQFQKGLESFFRGIEKALEVMGPAVDPMAKSLGGLFDLMGKILPQVADLIADIMIKWGPAFDEIIKAIEPLIPDIVELAKTFIDELAPILTQFAKEILPPLIDLLKELIPWATQAVKSLSPIIATTLTYIANGLKNFAAGIKAFNEGDGGKILTFLGKFSEAMKNFKWKTTGNLIVDIAVKVGWALAVTKVGEEAKKFLVNLAIKLTEQTKGAKIVFEIWVRSIAAEILRALLDFPRWFAEEVVPELQRIAKEVAKEVIRIILGKPSEGDAETKAKADEFGKSVFDNMMIGIQGAWALFKFRIKTWIDSVNPFHSIMEQIFGTSPAAGSGGSGGGVGSRTVPAKILPSVINEPAEQTWFDTFKTNMGTRMGTLPPVMTGAIGALGTIVGPQWAGFWNGLQTNANTNLTSTAGVVGNRLFGMNRDVGTFKTNALLNFGTWGAQTQAEARGTMGTVAGTIAGRLIDAGGSVGGFVSENLPRFLDFFNQSGTTATNRLSGMKRDTDGNMSSMSQTTGQKTRQMSTDSRSAFLAMAVAALSNLPRMVSAVQANTSAAISIASAMGSRIVGALNASYSSMVSSGAALVSGFASGMSANLGVVTSAAFAVAAAVRAAMPHSPAKVGPLSGMGYTTHSGRALVKDLAGGMMDNMYRVRQATAAIAGAANVGANLDINGDLGENGIVIDRREVNLSIVNPVAEPTSRSVEKASNTIRLAGGM